MRITRDFYPYNWRVGHDTGYVKVRWDEPDHHIRILGADLYDGVYRYMGYWEARNLSKDHRAALVAAVKAHKRAYPFG